MSPTMEEVAGWLREAQEEINNLVVFSGNYPSEKQVFNDRAAQVEALGWRPIEECPKNGTYIDLWDSSAKKRLTDCRWDGNNRWIRWDENAFGVMAWCVVKGKITHFMPLPQPPVKK